jgi:hypothetical protein
LIFGFTAIVQEEIASGKPIYSRNDGKQMRDFYKTKMKSLIDEADSSLRNLLEND